MLALPDPPNIVELGDVPNPPKPLVLVDTLPKGWFAAGAPKVDVVEDTPPNVGALDDKLPKVLPGALCPPMDPNVGVLLVAPPIAPKVGALVDEPPPNTDPGVTDPNVGVPPNAVEEPNAGAAPKAGAAWGDRLAGALPNVEVAPKEGCSDFPGVDCCVIPKPCDATLAFPDENDPKLLDCLVPPNAVVVLLLPNIDVELLDVAVELGDANNVLFVFPPPKMLPLVDVEPPKIFFEADSEDGAEPRPLKNPPLPPNMLSPGVEAFVDFISVFPPNIEGLAVEAVEVFEALVP